MTALVAALLTGLLGSLAGLVVVGLTAGPAYATDYRYWSYWKSSGGPWVYSNVGASSRPADGAVEGWRFGVGSPSAVPRPRSAPDFATTCAGTAAVDGVKRVAVVVDFGVAADAPPGEHPPGGATATCVTVPADANGYQALQEAFRVRTNTGGLVCGIDGYPARECGTAVSAASPATTPASTPQASSPPAATVPPAPNRTAPTPTPAASPHNSTQASTATSAQSATADGSSAQPGTEASPSTSPSGSPEVSNGPATDAVDAGDESSGGSSGSRVVLVLSLLAASAVGTAAFLRGRRARRS